ncbi:uncharacterized protein LOC105182856 [Harpegnathos saltator]|uniref:Uncharacterized protein n=1 Tax=Harpegnathos saltator TaxID=610380 RepID=E2BHL0_HARSA|nr:uncharacterized protein LOC105182856 [Harpegnathos saltator]EFN84819.1 hypothetical protein EAI_10277 [Harpegnathos saltator]
MPGHRQPNSLVMLSLGRVCEQLDGTCRRLQSLSQRSTAARALAFARRMIRPYYVNALPTRLRSQVIEETSRMLCLPLPDEPHVVSEPAILFLLSLLLDRDIKRLKVQLCCYYGCSYQTSLLELLASEGTGLESLHLFRYSLLRMDCNLLRSTLSNMKNLTILTLRNIANDAMLRVIGKTCPKLIILDVACSREVTDAGLKQLLLHVEFKDKVLSVSARECTNWSRMKRLLTRWKMSNSKWEKKKKQNVLLEYYESKNPLCDTLRVLNIADTCVTEAGVSLALLNITQLESLAEYKYIGHVVETVDIGQSPWNLTEAISCETTPVQLKFLAQMCPNMRRLSISEPWHYPEALRVFPHLTSLSMHNIPTTKEWLENLYSYLRAHGQHLRELGLWMTEQRNIPLQMDLKEILSSCPNLHTLVNDGAKVVWTEGCDPPLLRYLRKIELGHTVDALTITKVFSLAPGLTALHVHSCFDLTNQHLEKLSEPPVKSNNGEKSNECDSTLSNLTCFYIHQASKVSANTVLNMINSYKRLRQIGNLANWVSDYESVVITIARANLNVDLCSDPHWNWNNCIQ